MRNLLVLLFALVLSACASMHYAGVAEYTVRPIVVADRTICCEVSIKNGKEYASLKASVQKTGDNYTVTLDEQAVQAFAGQKVSAEAIKNAAESAASISGTAIAAPALGNGITAVLPVLAK